MTDSESLANSIDQKFKKLIQLHQDSLAKIVELKKELDEHKKKAEKDSEFFLQSINKQLKNHEVLEQKNLLKNKEIKQAIGILIEEINNCMDYISKSEAIEKDKQ